MERIQLNNKSSRFATDKRDPKQSAFSMPQEAIFGQTAPTSSNDKFSDKLRFEEGGVSPPGEAPAASGQVGQKPKRRHSEKLRREAGTPRPSGRLQHEGEPAPPGAEASVADKARQRKAGAVAQPTPGGDRLSGGDHPPGEATAAPDDGGHQPVYGDAHPGEAPPTHDAAASAPEDGAAPKPDKKAVRDGKRLDKSKLRMEKAEGKLDKARDKLAKRKPPKKPGIVKKAGGLLKAEAWAVVHGKIYQAEHENVGVKAAHRTELAGEGVVHSASRFVKRRVRTRPARQARKWEKREIKARADYNFRVTAKDHPELKSNPFSRYTQKRKLRKQYRKQARRAARTGGTLARRTAEAVAKTARAAVMFVVHHPMAALIIAAAFLFIVTLQSCVGGALTVGHGLLGALGGTSYLTEDADITNAGLAYTEWETDLLLEAQNAEDSLSGYDEYIFNIDPVGHDHITLISFLTAKYDDFTFSEAEPVLREIFDAQYELTFDERVEQRGGDGEDEEPYDWYILEVTLTARPFDEVLSEMLAEGEEQDRYDIYNITKGNRQYVGSPFPLNWLPYVTDTFGWRVHPITGDKDFHRAIDIALPAGTDILAGGEGVVAEATIHELYGNTVKIDYGEGITARYSHCSVLLVSAGQEVEAGTVIARVGSTGASTGPHLDLEVLKNGELLDPLNFVEIPF